MEKLNFIDKILDKWISLEPVKKVSYITGVIIVVLSSIVIYQAREITNIENEHKMVVDKLNSRTDMLLGASEERVRDCQENFRNYLQQNEKETRDILFKYEEYKRKLK